MTEEELKAIEERANKATSGPWHWHQAPGFGADCFLRSRTDKTYSEYTYIASGITGFANCEFIAHAREDIPNLIGALREAKQLLRDTAAAARELLDNDGAGGIYNASKAFKARQRLRELVFSERPIYVCGTCGFRGDVLVDYAKGTHHRPSDANFCNDSAHALDISGKLDVAICGWCAGTGKEERTDVVCPKCGGAGGKSLKPAGESVPDQQRPLHRRPDWMDSGRHG